jgi:hypothetical protein
MKMNEEKNKNEKEEEEKKKLEEEEETYWLPHSRVTAQIREKKKEKISVKIGCFNRGKEKHDKSYYDINLSLSRMSFTL